MDIEELTCPCCGADHVLNCDCYLNDDGTCNTHGKVGSVKEMAIVQHGQQGVQSAFLQAVMTELARARAKHIGNIHSLHEGYAVLLEETDELWSAIKKQRPDRENIREELVQVAAMAWRMAVDCGLEES